jgi:hypothetical protein
MTTIYPSALTVTSFDENQNKSIVAKSFVDVANNVQMTEECLNQARKDEVFLEISKHRF